MRKPSLRTRKHPEDAYLVACPYACVGRFTIGGGGARLFHGQGAQGDYFKRSGGKGPLTRKRRVCAVFSHVGGSEFHSSRSVTHKRKTRVYIMT